jgi:hypothetical protein
MAAKLRSPPRLDNGDGPVKICKASMGPFKFLKGRAEAEKKDRCRSWTRGFPEGHILEFIKYGLEPFLVEFGYKIGYSYKECAAYCKQWAFAHAEIQNRYKPNQTVQFLQCAHNGSREAFEWYLGIISPDDWNSLCTEWSGERFLDESDAGHAQRIDIAWFVWNLLSLDNSKAYHKFVEYMSSEEDMDDEIHYVAGFNGEEGSGIYGGDRRTL